MLSKYGDTQKLKIHAFESKMYSYYHMTYAQYYTPLYTKLFTLIYKCIL